jgi:hypothetical protein
MDIVVHGVDRITIGRRSLGLARAGGAGCAADIGDDHRLADVLLEFDGEWPEDVVGIAARGPWHNHLDGAVGILRHRRRR